MGLFMKKNYITKDAHTIAEHRFKTADGEHKLYVQEWGAKQGVPILFLHGGPGVGCKDSHKNYFSPKKHRVIFLDQRGSGHSTPYGSLKHNNTQKLIDDIEQVRRQLRIKKWHIEGASWGSTLALTYAIKHPANVKSLVILGVFLGSRAEINWIESGLYKTFYPDVYEQHPVQTFRYNRKSDQKAYLKLSFRLLGLDDRPKQLPDDQDLDLQPIKIELYYLNNDCFLSDNYILDNADKLKMPVTIIQGRYDMIAPPLSAYRLSRILPNCSFQTTLTGHLPSDRESYSVLKAVLSTLQ